MYWLSRCFIWLFCKVWFRLGRRGVALFPRQGPVLVAANHGSYLDPLLLGSTVPRRIRFVARGNLGKVPVVQPDLAPLPTKPPHHSKGYSKR